MGLISKIQARYLWHKLRLQYKFSKKRRKETDKLIENLKRCNKIMDASRELAYYWGKRTTSIEGEEIFYYEEGIDRNSNKDALVSKKGLEGAKLIIHYDENEWGYEPVPRATLELIVKVAGEKVLISRSNPAHRMVGDDSHNDFFFTKELDPDIVDNIVLEEFSIKSSAKESNPRFFFEEKLAKFGNPNLYTLRDYVWREDISLDALKDLEAKLTKIESADTLGRVKEHYGWKLISDFINIIREREHEQLDPPQISVIVKQKEPKCRESTLPGLGTHNYRKDLGFSVRSSWEANYARILIHDGVEFEYEPQTFVLKVPEDMKSIFRGKDEVKYTPDFKRQDTGHFVEIKGTWYNFNGMEAMGKCLLFQRLHPEYILEIIGIQEYRKLEKTYKGKINSSDRFLGWEQGSRHKKNLKIKKKNI